LLERDVGKISRKPWIRFIDCTSRRTPIYSNDKTMAENDLGERLRLVRIEVFGEDGSDVISEQLEVAPGTWDNYEEIGEAMPAQTLLRFIELTGVDPLWLMRGEGRKYRQGRRTFCKAEGAAVPSSW
jgi:hypothetical protein